MSGVVTRWEKERSAWLMARSRPGTSARRRAELLGRRARRLGRGGAGVAQTSLHEDVTPPLFRRMLATDDGAGEQLLRLVGVPVLFGIVLLAVGPALAISAGLYWLQWKKAPKSGRLFDWPWFIASGLTFAIGIMVQSLANTGPGTWFVPWPPALHVYLPVLIPTWAWVQTALGLALTGWLVHANGWAAVPKGAVPKPDKDRNGEFIRTPERNKVRLDPLAGVAAVPGSKTEPAKRLPKFALSAVIPQDEAPLSAAVEEEPVFADEDEGLEQEIIFDDPAQ